jgi:hypothetical protein
MASDLLPRRFAEWQNFLPAAKNGVYRKNDAQLALAMGAQRKTARAATTTMGMACFMTG